MNRREFLTGVLTLPAWSAGRRVEATLERLGASTACMAGLPLPAAIERLHELGFATLEMIMYAGARHSVGEIPGFAYERSTPADRDAVFASTRRFRHISGHLPFQDIALFSAGQAERRGGLQRLQRAIDGLAFLRGEMAVMHVGWPAKGSRFRDIWQPMIDVLRSLGDYSAQRSIRLGIETMQPDSVRDFTDLIAETDHANVGAVMDTGHIRGSVDVGIPAERRDTEDARARFNHVLNTLVGAHGKKVFHVHLSDVRRSDWADHREIGSGIIDWPRLFTTLRRSGFGGLYVFELEEPDTTGALQRSRLHVEKMVGSSASV